MYSLKIITFCNLVRKKMDFEKRNRDRNKRLPSKKSIHTIIEISKKINELLGQMEYSNNKMLLTKEHIKHNLIQLINYAEYQSKIKTENINKSTEVRNLELNTNCLHNYSIDNRGKLIANYAR